MMLWTAFAVASLIGVSCADVSFTTPAAGESIIGTTINVEWEESGTGPALSSLTTYDLFLYAGGDTDGGFVQLAALKHGGHFADGNAASGTIPHELGANVMNAYFLKMISTGSSGPVINYSKRFSIPSMKGTFPSHVESGLKAMNGTNGLAAQDQAVIVNLSARDGSPFDVPYQQQSGPIRYAPMGKVPPTKITVKAATPMFSPFPYSIFVSAGGPPNVQSTVTQPQTFHPSQREATMTPAAMPSDSEMAKFLRRWAD